MPNKSRSLWPLPGGAEGFVKTLTEILEYIDHSTPSEKDLMLWFNSSNNLRGNTAPNGYIRVIEQQLALIQRTPNGFELSNKAKEFLRTKDNRVILKVLIDRILGIDEILIILSTNEAKLSEIQRHLVSKLGVNWVSPNQMYYRLNWLRSLGCVEVSNQKYHLTGQGIIAANELQKSSTTEFRPPSEEVSVAPSIVKEMAIKTREFTHYEIIQLLVALGEVFGYKAESEVKLSDILQTASSDLSNRKIDVVWKEPYRLVPIEVQAHGSIDALVNRLRVVEPRSHKMVVVATTEDIKKIEEYAEYESRGFREKITFLPISKLAEISEYMDNIDMIRGLRRTIGL